MIPLAPFFFVRIALAILGLLWFHIKFRIICSSFVKNAIDNLIRIALTLQIALGSMVILTILILPIQEHYISFHLFVHPSSISFISVLQFSAYGYFASLGRFIPRYSILFDAVVNGIASLISLSDISLLVYRNATEFSILILYSSTLPNLLMISTNFLIASLGFSMYSVMSSSNCDSFTSFSIWIPFTYLFFFSDCCG